VIQLRTGLAIVEVENGKVVLDPKRGVYWHLNQSAIAVIEELAQGRAFDDLVAQIARDTGTDEGRVRKDHLALVDELRRGKLIQGDLR
jgi:hypothetical protein